MYLTFLTHALNCIYEQLGEKLFLVDQLVAEVK